MSASPYIHEGTPENFQALVIEASHQVPVLVDFWAAWCNPCQMLLPIVTRLAEEYEGKFHLVKVNSDEQQALANEYGVRSLPTLKLFRDGAIVEEIMGAQPEATLRALLDQYVARESDQLVVQALELAEAGQLPEAEKCLQQAIQDDPGNARLPLELARITVMLGNLLEAQQLLEQLPVDQRESAETKLLLAQIHAASTIQDSPPPDELVKHIEQDPADLMSRYQLAAWRSLEGDHEAALQELLEIMKRDRQWNEEAGRKGMLKIFEMLGNEGELVSRYRRQMFNLLH